MLSSVLPRLATDSAVRVFAGVWKLLSFYDSLPGQSSIPISFVSLFIFYIFSYLLSKTMGCFSGCLMSSAGIQKLFCGIYSAFKCSFDESVGEKLVSPSYSSSILGLHPMSSSNCCFLTEIIVWFLSFNLLIWCIILIDLHILKNPCIPGINPA